MVGGPVSCGGRLGRVSKIIVSQLLLPGAPIQAQVGGGGGGGGGSWWLVVACGGGSLLNFFTPCECIEDNNNNSVIT